MAFLRLLLAAILLHAAPGAFADRHIDELMRKSGLWEQAGQVHAQVKAGAVEARKQGQEGAHRDLSDSEFARLVAALNNAYAPPKLRATVTRELAAALTEDDEAAALTWLSTDLGTRITRLEEQSGEAERSRDIDREAPGFLGTVAPERAAKFARLAEAARAGEYAAGLLIDITTAIAYGMTLATPRADPAIVPALHERLQSQRERVVPLFTQRAIAIYAYLYRDLSDDEVERYVAFAESDAGRRFHAASSRALGSAIAQASLDLGVQFAALNGDRDRRS